MIDVYIMKYVDIINEVVKRFINLMVIKCFEILRMF